jgi:hypothetical protein
LHRIGLAQGRPVGPSDGAGIGAPIYAPAQVQEYGACAIWYVVIQEKNLLPVFLVQHLRMQHACLKERLKPLEGANKVETVREKKLQLLKLNAAVDF